MEVELDAGDDHSEDEEAEGETDEPNAFGLTSGEVKEMTWRQPDPLMVAEFTPGE